MKSLAETTFSNFNTYKAGSSDVSVSDIKRRVQHWRLTDSDAPTLEQMRHGLVAEIQGIERQLSEADEDFQSQVAKGNPLEAKRAQDTIELLASDWDDLTSHVQEVDEALQERRLRNRIVEAVGSELRANIIEGLVLILIVVVVSLTVVDLFFPISEGTSAQIRNVDLVISIILVVEFFARMSLADSKSWYFRRYWVDLVASLPFQEFLRFGRLVRITRFARVLRVARLARLLRVFLFIFRGVDKLFRTLQLNLVKRAMAMTIILLVLGALGISFLEGAYEASLQETGESLWWSFATVVTGGYGDIYNPITTSGRIVTVILVLLGLTVSGILTASLTSVLVEDDSVRLERQQNSLESHLETIDQRLRLMSRTNDEGLNALETVSQALSNQRSREEVSSVLAARLLDDYECLQASIHLYDRENEELVRIYHAGEAEAAPAGRLKLRKGWIGHFMAELLALSDAAGVDLEPETEPRPNIRGVAMLCPLVAGRQVLGILHVVLPGALARYHLYNRVPMILAHHAALAFYAIDPDIT